MSSLSSIDKLPNMAAKTDAVSPCKQITCATDVTPVKWGYFLCVRTFGRMSYSIFFKFSNQTCFLCWENLWCIRGWRRLVKTEWVSLVFILKHSVWNTLSFAVNVGKRQVVKTSDSHHLSQNLPADALLNLTVSIRSHPKGQNNIV